jgi:hypothetical protein
MAFERITINGTKTIHETVDGEVVIINLDTGHYYSLDKTGATVWSIIRDSATVEEIVEGMLQRYDGRRVDVEQGVTQLITQLHQEDLIVCDEAEVSEDIKEPNMQDQLGLESERLRFEMPVLRKYTDMQQLLLIDPIHEVDETGWPNRGPRTAE